MIEQHGTLEISRSRFLHNLALLRSQLGATKICATLKANAYGHGAGLIAKLAGKAQIEWAAVYNLQEALGILPSPPTEIAILGLANNTKVLVLAPIVITPNDILPPDFFQAAQSHVRLNVIDPATAKSLSAALQESNIPHPLNIHIQIDTGLTRSGAPPESIRHLADTIANLPNLHLEGIFAHFPHADVPGHPTVHEQAQRFHNVADPLRKKYPHLLIHLQNSGAAFHLTDNSLDIAHIGIALYGLQPSTAHLIADLQPIARLTAPILTIHEVPANTGVGYGHTFITHCPSRLAIVPVGYAEGYPRSLSNNAVAQIHNTDAPVVGRISMDQIILDITDIPAAKIGDTATLISWDPAKPNSIDRIADATNTIGYEIATHLGSRLHRIIVD